MWLILAFILVVSGTSVNAQAASFSDVPKEAYYASAVSWAVEKNVTSGTGAAKFSPRKGCTRAQIVAFLYRFMGSPEVSAKGTQFFDVGAGKYYQNAVNWAVEKGITSGTGKGKFSPDAVCTRAQAVTFLHKAMASQLKDEAASNPFKDVSSAKYYYHSVLWALNYKVTGGTKADRFSPNSACTRAQIVSMLYRASNAEVTAEKVSLAIDGAQIVDGTDGKQVCVHGKVTNPDNQALTVSLYAVEPYAANVQGAAPIAHQENITTDVTFYAPLHRDEASSLLQKKFYMETTVPGQENVLSNAFYIENPEAAADNQEAYPMPARGTKKGLKTMTRDTDIEMAKTLNVSHVAIDVEVGRLLSGKGLTYTYEGQTYEFSKSILVNQQVFKKYHDEGIKVMVVVYMAINAPRDCILPSAVSGSRYGKATLYAWNTANASRKKLEALMACLTDYWTSGGAHVADWVFSNEIDHYSVYHYSGDISYSDFVQDMADNYRMFNASIKSRYANARCYLCFDHNWNLDTTNLPGWYRGKNLLDDIHKALEKEGLVHFDVSLHPYPVPEQWPCIWERMGSITDSGDSPQYSPLNAGYIASYIKQKYGADTHIIMSETGITSKYRNNGTVTDMENEQAASIVLAYYLAEFNSNIDSITIHREMDQSGETAGGWYLGLFRSSYDDPKPSANAYAYMDTPDYESHTSQFLPLIKMNGQPVTSWAEAVPGFDPNRFA